MYIRGKNNLNCTCPICGKKFHLKPSKLKVDKNHYCSKKCCYESKKENMKGENNHQYGLRGELNASWKGGRKVTHWGYCKVCSPNHPFRDCDNMVFEHRLVAEKYLLNEENSIEIDGALYLRKEFIVHHKDGNKLNNDVSNLEVMKKSKHTRLHNLLSPVPRDSITGRFI